MSKSIYNHLLEATKIQEISIQCELGPDTVRLLKINNRLRKTKSQRTKTAVRHLILFILFHKIIIKLINH